MDVGDLSLLPSNVLEPSPKRALVLSEFGCDMVKMTGMIFPGKTMHLIADNSILLLMAGIVGTFC